MSEWRFFLDQQPWVDLRRLFIARQSHDGKTSHVQPFLLETLPLGSTYDNPALVENGMDGAHGDVNGFLQAALDCAWEAGMRPRAFADHTNELAAVRYHLEDMRTLTGKLGSKP